MDTVVRIHDTAFIDEASKRYNRELIGFDPEDWSEDKPGLAMRVGEDLALFEYDSPGVYTGHFFFVSRGRTAYDVSCKILDEVFSRYAEVVKGLTPVEHKGAIWLSKKLGFKEYGLVPTVCGDCTLFVQTKKEWNKQ